MKRSAVRAFLAIVFVTSSCVMGCSAEPQSTEESAPPASDDAKSQTAAASAQPSSGEPAGINPQDSICGPGLTWTCCPCGGCGCRPENISPRNFCGC